MKIIPLLKGLLYPLLLDNGPLSYSGVDTIIHNVPNNTGQKDVLRRPQSGQLQPGLVFQQKRILPQILGSLIPSQTTQDDRRTCNLHARGVQSTQAISEHSRILPISIILPSFVTIPLNIYDVSGIDYTDSLGFLYFIFLYFYILY
jgi:hypothetical protein